MKALVIDLGSSFVKSAILDLENGKLLSQKKTISSSKRRYDDKLLFEVPVGSIVDTVKELLDQGTREYGDLTSLLLSTQMHGFVYRTGQTPEPVYVSWQDMRCLHQKSPELTYLGYLQELFSKEDMEDCGVYIKPSLGLCNLYTMLEENPGLDRNGTLYTLGSYVIEQLTGNNICHITNAAPLGLVDVRRRRWSEKILRKAGFEGIRLPQLAPSDFASYGSCTVNGRTVSVYPDYGDQQIAVLGSMPEQGDGLINIATAGQVSMVSEVFEPGEYEIRPYFEGRVLRTISNMPSGRGLDVLVRFITGGTKLLTGAEVSVGEFWSAFERQFVEDSQGIAVDMSFYATPQKLDGGEIRGITQNNLNVNTLFSAAFRDMAETYWKNLGTLAGSQPLERVVCSGGVSWKRPELIRMIGRVTGLPCRLSALDDEAMAGLYRMALCCSGICRGLDDKREMILRL